MESRRGGVGTGQSEQGTAYRTSQAASARRASAFCGDGLPVAAAADAACHFGVTQQGALFFDFATTDGWPAWGAPTTNQDMETCPRTPAWVPA